VVAVLALAAAALPIGAIQAGGAGGPAAADSRSVDAPPAAAGSVIFLHPDGAGLNHWGAARLYFKGPDGSLKWDRLPHMAVYRGHMSNVITGTSNGGATTHAFGYKVDGFGSFGRDGDRELAREIRSLSGYAGSLMREAAGAGIPVGVVNDGHIGEPGTGAFLAEVGNRDNRQEIVRQMIQGRPGRNDATPWVIMGGGEADTLPAGATLTHRNVNRERGAPPNGRTSLRTDALDLQADWNAKGSGNLSNDPLQHDDYVVVRTRAEFERLRRALEGNRRYAPRVLGLFAFHDLFNDRDEQSLIDRGFVRPEIAPGQTGPAPAKRSRIVLWGDHDAAEAGYDPPTFAEMIDVAITILQRAASRQRQPGTRRFFLVGEQESADNFGNRNNAIGVLHALRDTDEAIGVALRHLKRDPRTLILVAADSDAGGLQVAAPPVAGVTPPTNILPPGRAPDLATGAAANPSSAAPGAVADSTTVANFADGVEGRQSPLFVTEPDQFGNRMQFGVLWAGTPDFSGGTLSRAAGLNGGLLTSLFNQRFDNVDVYRLMHLTLFGRLLEYPTGRRAPTRSNRSPQ
jgi:alkaline phosphatase